MECYRSFKTENDGDAVKLVRFSRWTTCWQVSQSTWMVDVARWLEAAAKLDALRTRQRRIRRVEEWNAMGRVWIHDAAGTRKEKPLPAVGGGAGCRDGSGRYAGQVGRMGAADSRRAAPH